MIQVLYQGASRFVLLSHVLEVEVGEGASVDREWRWVVNVAVGDSGGGKNVLGNETGKGKGKEGGGRGGRSRGRWWRGWWGEDDVRRFVVCEIFLNIFMIILCIVILYYTYIILISGI